MAYKKVSALAAGTHCEQVDNNSLQWGALGGENVEHRLIVHVRTGCAEDSVPLLAQCCLCPQKDAPAAQYFQARTAAKHNENEKNNSQRTEILVLQ